MHANLLIPGAAKCGTTSLARILDTHPDVHLARPKEPALYLDQPIDPDRVARAFESYEGQRYRCDATQRYFIDETVPRRLSEYAPDAKFIICVREPVSRFTSHYNFRLKRRAELRSICDILASEQDESILKHGAYAQNLEHYLRYFDLGQFHVIDLSDLAGNAEAVLSGVLRFLNLEEIPLSLLHENPGGRPMHPVIRGTFRVMRSAGLDIVPSGGFRTRVSHLLSQFTPHVAGETVQPSAHERQQLIDLYEPEVIRLEALTGCSFAEWRHAW